MRSNIFRSACIIICLFTFASCAIAVKKKRPLEPAKSVEKKEEEKKSIYSYYLEAEKIIKKGRRRRFNEARKNIMYIIGNADSSESVFNLVDAYQLLGLLNMKERRYSEAIEAYEMALQKDNKSLQSLTGIGLSYLKLNKLEKAEEIFKKIIAIEAINYAAQMNLGTILYKKKDYKKAIEYFKRAISLKEKDYRPYFNIAETYYAMGKYDDAEMFYRRAIKINASGALRAKNNLSYMLLKDKKFEEALDLLNGKEISSSNYANAYINFAVAQRTAGKLEEAEKSYLKALELNPQSTTALINIGILYDVYFGKRELAMHYYQKYIELDGRDKKDVEKWIRVIKGSGAKKEK